MRRFKYAGLLAASAFLLCGAAQASATAGGKFGPEFTIDTADTGQQDNPAVAISANGAFVATWVDASTDPDNVVYRRYSLLGEPLGDAEIVGVGRDPAIAMSATGQFVIAYNRGLHERYALFGSSGALIKDVPVDAADDASSPKPVVSMDADGRFVISYFKPSTGDTKAVVTRRFDATGTRIGGDIVSRFDGAHCDAPIVASAANGRFVVGCIITSGATKSVQGEIYDATGAPVDGVLKVNLVDAPDLSQLHAAMDGAGNLLMAWTVAGSQITGRYLNLDGVPLSEEFTAAIGGPTGLSFGGLSMSALGMAVFTWDTRGQGDAQADGSDVFERAFTANHVGREPQQVNGTTPRPHKHQFAPAVAVDADGDFTVVWQDGDAGTSHVLGQRFTGLENVDLSLDVADAPDPAQGGEQVSYTFTVENLHPVTTPVSGASGGVQTVNHAVGGAQNVEIAATVPSGGGEFVQIGSTDWDQCRFDEATSTVHCVYNKVLGPGETTSFSLRRAAPTIGKTATVDALLTAYQFDANQDNNHVSQTTTVTGNLPTVQFAVDHSSVTEDAGTQHVTVTLSEPLEQDATVAFSATNASTANAPADYTLSPSPLTIPAGQTSADIIVTIKDDTASELAETVVLQLTSTSPNVQIGPPSTHTLTIQDNEPVFVQFHEVGAETVAEDGAPVTFQLDLSHVSTQDVTVSFSTGGTATPTTDYTLTPGNGTVTIPAGQLHGSITVTPVDDAVDEFDETVQLTLTSATNATLGTNVTSSVTITDNDAASVPEMEFQVSSLTVTEGGPDVVVTVVLSHPTTVPVTAQFTVGGTADSNDFAVIAPASGIVTVAPGQTTATITIDLRDDGVHENADTVVLTLTNPTGVTLGDQDTFTLTILDNDAGGIGSNTITIESAAQGRNVTFTTSQGKFSAISVVPPPNNPPAGLDYPLGFFGYVISDVAPNTIVTLTVDVPADSGITDWIDCLENSCFRSVKDPSPDPGQVNVDGDQITIVIQDQGQGDHDPRPGFIASKVAPAKPPEDEGGSMTWLLLAPLFGAAALRRRQGMSAR